MRADDQTASIKGGITARAPVRADLAGGTLDIWPLGLLHPGAVTVAVAVSLFAQVRVAPASRRGALLLRSLDLGSERRIDAPWPALRPSRLELLERLGRLLAPGGAVIESRSPVGAGSGLGTSSALGIAAAAALTRLSANRAGRQETTVSGRGRRKGQDGPRPGGGRLDREKLIRLVRDTEAQILGIPTGTQDHRAAWVGGALVIEHQPGGGRVHRLGRGPFALLSRSLLLVDSGRSRSSGPSNWDMIRRRLDGDAVARRALARVAAAGRRAAEALATGDGPRLGRAMTADLEARKAWSPLVVTPEFEEIFRAARRAGAWGFKVCGAGGGGYGAVLAPPEHREPVVAALEEAGAVVSPARPAARGLRITSS